MIKPKRLKKGDKVAIVSLSSGLLGEKGILHKYEIGKKRLEEKLNEDQPLAFFYDLLFNAPSIPVLN